MSSVIVAALESWLAGELVPAMKTYIQQARTRQGVRGSYSSNAVASGRLLNSLKPGSETRGDTVFGFVTAVDYAEYVDQGRGPGGMPPIQAIARWMQAKGIEGSPYPIAKAIAEKGTNKPPVKFVERGLTDTLPALGNALDRAASAAAISEIMLSVNALTIRDNG